ncbi:MAG: methyl-accepting chemotaxis protein [Limnochordaceae bacterium]|nr:methyl-accepting chemotaxis protein [Limnochordaceae bacterium]
MRLHPVHPQFHTHISLREQFRGLRLQLLLWFVVLALGPAAALSFLASSLTNRAVVQQMQASMLVQAKELGDRLDQFISERLSDIRNLTTLETMQRPDVAPEIKAKAVRSALDNGIVAAYLLDAGGNPIVSEGAAVTTNLASATWFQSAMGGQEVVQDLASSPVSGKPTLVIAVPVWSVDGMIQGVLAAELSQQSLQQLVDQVTDSYKHQNLHGYAFVLNRAGQHVTTIPGFGALQSNAMAGIQPALKQADAGNDGVVTIQIGHAPWLAAFTPLTGYGTYTGNHWTLFVARPSAELSAEAHQMQLYVFVALGLLLILSLLLAVFVSGRIAHPLQQVTHVLQEVAAGRLDVAVADRKGNDEVAILTGAVQRMLASLRQVVERVTGTAQQVQTMSQNLATGSQQAAAATQQIAQTVSQVAAGAQEQTKVVGTSSQNVQELIDRIAQLAEGATRQRAAVEQTVQDANRMDQALAQTQSALEEVSILSEQNAETASAGSEAVGRMVNSMDRIQKSTEEVATRVRELEGHSQAIGEILEVIQSIAEQTNLLALNAAIEAARVGEQGKGFAVVAEEIRRLAERSSHETQQIGHIVADVRAGIKRAVEAIQVGSQEVDSGNKTVRETGEALELIRSGAEETGQKVAQVVELARRLEEASKSVRASTEAIRAISQQNQEAATAMAERTQEVRTSMESLAAVSQENAASSEEVSASTEQMNASIQEMTTTAEQLAKLARDLSAAVNQFRL